MNSTGLIESWTINPFDVGPIYPFVGSEGVMLAISTAFFIGFVVWKFVTESKSYAAKANQLRDSAALDQALDAHERTNAD